MCIVCPSLTNMTKLGTVYIKCFPFLFMETYLICLCRSVVSRVPSQPLCCEKGTLSVEIRVLTKSRLRPTGPRDRRSGD